MEVIPAVAPQDAAPHAGEWIVEGQSLVLVVPDPVSGGPGDGVARHLVNLAGRPQVDTRRLQQNHRIRGHRTTGGGKPGRLADELGLAVIPAGADRSTSNRSGPKARSE